MNYFFLVMVLEIIFKIIANVINKCNLTIVAKRIRKCFVNYFTEQSREISEDTIRNANEYN